MPKPKAEKPDTRFITNLEDQHCGGFGGSYLIFTAEVCVQTWEGPRFPSFSTYSPEPGSELTGLVVRAQLDSTAKGFYGFRAEFKPYAVDLGMAESMVKVLRKIERRMSDLATRFGYPADLAAYMGHLASALDASQSHCFGQRVKGDADINGTGYRWMDVDWLRVQTNKEADEWRTKHGYVVANAA